jgi:Flp pilus assembly pilin Flp
MKPTPKTAQILRKDTSGAGLAEYAIITGFISVLVVASVSFLSGEISRDFTQSTQELSSVVVAEGMPEVAPEPTPPAPEIIRISGRVGISRR